MSIRVMLEVSDAVHEEIRQRLIECGAGDLLGTHPEHGVTLDMHEIVLVRRRRIDLGPVTVHPGTKPGVDVELRARVRTRRG